MVLGDFIIKTKAFGAFSDKADSGAFQKRGQFPPEQRQRTFPNRPSKVPILSYHFLFIARRSMFVPCPHRVRGGIALVKPPSQSTGGGKQ